MPVSAVLNDLRSALKARDRASINATTRALLDGDAALGAQWRAIAMVMAQNGEVSMAADAISRFAAAEGNSPTARYEMAALLHRVNRIDEALAVMRQIPEEVPSVATHGYVVGTLLSKLGDFTGARQHLMRAVETGPANGHNWLALAMAGDAWADPVVAERIVDPAGPIDDATFGERQYARGIVHAGLGDHEAAFSAFASGAGHISRQRPYNAVRDSDVAQTAAEFDRRRIAAIASRITIPTDRPIIVTGNPRSGTTLVQQLLRGHSAVSGGDELGFARILGQDIGGFSLAALEKYVAGGAAPDQPAALYLHLADERFGKTGRFVDKTLTASRTLATIAAILPEAPLIWVRRAPEDCAWSCFRTYFLSGHDWSWSFETIAQHFRLEDELLARYLKALGDRLLVVQYEDLVRDPEAVLPDLLGHCGLAMESDVLELENHRGAINTTSVSQARRPVNTSAIGASAPYRSHMQAFIDAYSA